MSPTLTVDYKFHLQRRGPGRHKEICPGAEPKPVVEPGRIPRVARLMALAIRFESLIRDGTVGSYTELAVLGHVTRARITQIMNLLQLAPDIQEEILFLPKVIQGRDRLHLRQLQQVAGTLDWRRQREMWHRMWQAIA